MAGVCVCVWPGAGRRRLTLTSPSAANRLLTSYPCTVPVKTLGQLCKHNKFRKFRAEAGHGHF